MFAPLTLSRALPLIVVLLALASNVLSTRTVQFCKHRGENGNAEICVAMNTFRNTTTDAIDYYITLHTYRFKNSAKGWAAMGFGYQMKGALIFAIYGDPMANDGALTTSVRCAIDHHVPTTDMTDVRVNTGPVPEVTVFKSQFEEYSGTYVNAKLGFAPTHVGISHFVCHNCSTWKMTPIDPNDERQGLIWGTNARQVFDGDFSRTRNLEMHKFGMGFGMLWADMPNAMIETAHFPVIDESFQVKGMTETSLTPKPPTDDELDKDIPIEDFPPITPPAVVPTEADSTAEEAAKEPATEADTETEAGTLTDELSQPSTTILGSTLRSWLWHLHGLCMTLSFLILYPLGAYLLRRPSPSGRSFNFHWTIQALASIVVLIGAIIALWQSASISVAHQFFGLAIVAAILVQLYLGWSHHRTFTFQQQAQRRQRGSWRGRMHIWLGRAILISGCVNLIMGTILRRYGRATIILLCMAIVVEMIALMYLLGGTEVRNLALMTSGRVEEREQAAREAEEYFRLAGDDEEESDDEADGEGAPRERLTKEQERREQARRLAKLDRV